MADGLPFKRRSKLNRILRFPLMVCRHYALLRRQAALSTYPHTRWESWQLAWSFAWLTLRD